MARPRVIVLRTAGVNCEQETATAWERAGAVADIVHVHAVRADPERLLAAQILTVPGGFSYGDDIAAGRVFGNELRVYLADVLQRFVAGERLVLGICNGLQVLCNAGLLPGAGGGRRLSVTHNLSGRYEDRWVHLARSTDRCPFLSGLERCEMPVAHGEGRIMANTPADLQALLDDGHVALRYVTAAGSTAEYPANPNGSLLGAAGLCDRSGRVLGLMPHPERFTVATHHPEWTSRPPDAPADGLQLFEAGVAYFA